MLNVVLRKARTAIGLTTTEAGKMVYSTRKTIEHWESGKTAPPRAKAEMLLSKYKQFVLDNSIAVVFIVDELEQVIDCVAKDLLLSVDQVADGWLVKTLSTHRATDRPYVHKTFYHAVSYNLMAHLVIASWSMDNSK